MAIKGVRWNVAKAGIKTPVEGSKPLDIALMEIQAGASVSAVFTQNAFCAAPVHIAKAHLAQRDSAQASYLLINAGNANAGTGQAGFDASLSVCDNLAKKLSLNAQQVLPFSTGVIGELLPAEKIHAVSNDLLAGLAEDNWSRAAQAIMTTDTQSKHFSRKIAIGDKDITITGICKGAGMIQPNMATMLAYIATDASIDQAVLDSLLAVAVNQSFNRITVDGDTSTNDACVLVATGAANVAIESAEHLALFKVALSEIFIDLATAIIRDAEGATKFITLQVEGGLNDKECLDVAYTVANSPLVKTAFFASDANWGRILAAIGRAPIDKLDVERLSIYLDDVLICEKGGRADSYTEEQGAAVMANKDILVRIKLRRGSALQTVWTSDLSHDYVSINADYRS